MKRLVYIFLLAFPLLVTSCLIEEKEVFDKTPAERMDAFLAEYKALLESNENGWLFEYYPQKDQAYGGYNYILQFKDGYVTAWLELTDKEETSTYKMTPDDGPVLSFDTYNANLHFFAEASPSQYQGLQGDYEYNILGKSEDGSEIYVKGRKSGNTLTMRKFTGEDPVAYFAACNEVYEAVAAAKYDMTLDNVPTLSCSLSNMTFTFTVETKPATELVPAEVAAYSVAYCYTDTGIRFYEPIEVNGVTYEGLTYQDGALVSEDGKIVIVKGKLVIEDLVGAYSFTAISLANGSKVSGSMVLELSDNPEKGNMMFTTMFDTPCTVSSIYANFDATAGTLTVETPQPYYLGSYLYAFAKGSSSTGARVDGPVVFTANVGELSYNDSNYCILDGAFDPQSGAYLGAFEFYYGFTAKRVGQ